MKKSEFHVGARQGLAHQGGEHPLGLGGRGAQELAPHRHAGEESAHLHAGAARAAARLLLQEVAVAHHDGVAFQFTLGVGVDAQLGHRRQRRERLAAKSVGAHVHQVFEAGKL